VNIIQPPTILVIDDKPESVRAVFQLGRDAGTRFEVVHPDDVDRDLLNNADLVLVDYLLEAWTARTALSQISLRPENGVALAAVLREQANLLERPTGFAIHTGRPEALWLTPAEPRRHLIARAYNLEWVFLKSEPADVVRQATILAGAIRSLPSSWPGDDYAKVMENAQTLLGLGPELPDQAASNWAGAALADVENCRPPLTELSERNHGLVFLRWLLHRILPYPCFFYDSHGLAARLRISHASLGEGLTPQGLGRLLSRYRYRGALAGFLGERWWRAGIEDFLWDLTDGTSIPAATLRNKLSDAAGVNLAPSTTDSPIVCVDENFQPLPEACSEDVVVRIQPDDWPLYASQAWTTVDRARQHPRLRAVVAAEDRDKVLRPENAAQSSGGEK
jgi:CheY-like chemotaxis protein